MDYQPQNPQSGQNNGYPPYPPYGAPLQPNIVRPKGESMATAAMILGIISLVSLLFFQLQIPFLLGGVGIVLAILSRGSAKQMLGRAKAGLTCCIIGLSLDIVLFAAAIYLVFALPHLSPELMEEVNEACEEQYGMSYEEIMDEFYDIFE